VLLTTFVAAAGTLTCLRVDAQETSPETKPAEDAFRLATNISVNEEEAEIDIFFVGEKCVLCEMSDPSQAAVVIFDLQLMTWTDFSHKKSATLADCEAWAQASKERIAKSLETVTDTRLKRFVQDSIEPSLKSRVEDEVLILSNPSITYRFTKYLTVDSQRRKKFFTYDRLNAYHKSMTERKLPPFLQLAVDRELESRELIPQKFEAILKSPQGTFEVKCEVDVVDLTSQEESLIHEILENAGNPAP
jgi:hypothetical protein